MASADLAFALELADLADSLSLARFRALDLRIETKFWEALTDGGRRGRAAGSRTATACPGKSSRRFSTS
jgi:hypothetical protein